MGKLQNEDFKTLAELTGAGGSSSQLLNDSKVYVTANGINKQLSQAITDGDIGGGLQVISGTQSITASGTISIGTSKTTQITMVVGSSGPQTASTTPFGSGGGWVDGTLVEVVGTDDTNTVSIVYNDAANGAVGNFSTLTLAKYERARFRYVNALDRWVYVG